jgi:hypothetical protein
LAKTDFKSAFKTLGVVETQRWLQWIAYWDPDEGRAKAARTYTQTFGSIGAGTAWWRVARTLVQILRRVFHIPALIYVDDIFLVVPAAVAPAVLATLRWVTDELLGWATETTKSKVSDRVDILGAAVHLNCDSVDFAIAEDKRQMWLSDLVLILEADWLDMELAKKMAGRLQWAACHIFNRCAKAALRPIIQRQTDARQGFSLTPRLRQSVCWFIDLLKKNISRTILHANLRILLPRSLPVVYSDATGHGACGAVIVFPSGRTMFCRH